LGGVVSLKDKMVKRLLCHSLKHVIAIVPHIDPARRLIRVFLVLKTWMAGHELIQGLHITNGLCRLKDRL
jgi:hypothetical protein